jgi:hypothetical protein
MPSHLTMTGQIAKQSAKCKSMASDNFLGGTTASPIKEIRAQLSGYRWTVDAVTGSTGRILSKRRRNGTTLRLFLFSVGSSFRWASYTEKLRVVGNEGITPYSAADVASK